MRVFVQDILVDCQMMPNYNDRDFGTVFAAFDTNGDGQVDKEEMLTFMKSMFYK